MPPPIDPGKRAAIADAIRDGGTCRGIAREHQVAPDTVRRIAATVGIEHPFARTQTEDATRARMADLAAQRTEVSALFLRRAREALEQFDAPHVVFNIGGRDNVYTEHLMDRPPTGDMRNLATIAGIAVQRHMELARFDTDDGAKDAASLIRSLAAGLNVAAEHMTGGGEDADQPGSPAAEPQTDPVDR